MKKIFKTFSKEETRKVKGGKKVKEPREAKMDCPPPEPDSEF